MKDIVYLCGAITYNKLWKKQFSSAYDKYKKKYIVISPLKIYYMFLRTGKDISKITEYELNLIPKINKLIVINLFSNQSFANIELQYANYLKKEIINDIIEFPVEPLNNLTSHYLLLIAKLNLNKLKKDCREQPYIVLKRCYIYYLRTKYLLSLKQIGSILNLDHSTVGTHLNNYELYKNHNDHLLVISKIIDYFNKIEGSNNE